MPDVNWDSFRSLVHYVCHNAPSPEALGSTKLNKILFYSDVLAYWETGESITGETYVRDQFGPRSQHLLPAISHLVERNAISAQRSPFWHFKKRKEGFRHLYTSLAEPDKSRFNETQLKIVHRLISEICEGHTAESISKESHDLMWKAASPGEEIPYQAAIAKYLQAPRADAVQWARDFARESSS